MHDGIATPDVIATLTVTGVPSGFVIGGKE